MRQCYTNHAHTSNLPSAKFSVTYFSIAFVIIRLNVWPFLFQVTWPIKMKHIALKLNRGLYELAKMGWGNEAPTARDLGERCKLPIMVRGARH